MGKKSFGVGVGCNVELIGAAVSAAIVNGDVWSLNAGTLPICHIWISVPRIVTTETIDTFEVC